MSGGLNNTDWISQLSLGTFKDLSHCYFRNFNTALPILDEDVYFQRTLAAAMNSDFGINLDACIVLLVMALGSWGKGVEASADHVSPSNSNASQVDSPPGLAYFNEARRRMALFDCDVGFQNCQVYLLTG